RSGGRLRRAGRARRPSLRARDPRQGVGLGRPPTGAQGAGDALAGPAPGGDRPLPGTAVRRRRRRPARPAAKPHEPGMSDLPAALAQHVPELALAAALAWGAGIRLCLVVFIFGLASWLGY